MYVNGSHGRASGIHTSNILEEFLVMVCHRYTVYQPVRESNFGVVDLVDDMKMVCIFLYRLFYFLCFLLWIVVSEGN